MNEIVQDAMKAYADISTRIQELEQSRNELKPIIIGAFQRENIEKTETSLGTFSIYTTRKWEYTDAISKLEDKLKIAKTREEEKGIAKAKETPTLRFVRAKS